MTYRNGSQGVLQNEPLLGDLPKVLPSGVNVTFTDIHREVDPPQCGSSAHRPPRIIGDKRMRRYSKDVDIRAITLARVCHRRSAEALGALGHGDDARGVWKARGPLQCSDEACGVRPIMVVHPQEVDLATADGVSRRACSIDRRYRSGRYWRRVSSTTAASVGARRRCSRANRS